MSGRPVHLGLRSRRKGGALRCSRPIARLHDRHADTAIALAPFTKEPTRMTVRIRTITVDCADPYLLAGFWSQVTGYREDPENSNHPDDPEGLLLSPDGS